MFELLTQEAIEEIHRKNYHVEYERDEYVVHSRKHANICVMIGQEQEPLEIIRTTMKPDCGHENNCFDEAALWRSLLKNCPDKDLCIITDVMRYMPKIYVVSTYDPYVVEQNVGLKKGMQLHGLIPVLPQHLTPTSKTRSMYGGPLVQDPKLKGLDMGIEGSHWCEKVIRQGDGCVIVLNRMGQDSSWETGLTHGLGKPAMAVYYDDPETDPLKDFQHNWMVKLTELIGIARYPSREADELFQKFRRELHNRKRASP